MSVVLPTKKVAAETQDPKNLIIYGSPKVGKTTLLAELPNSLLIDLEEGSTYIDAVKVKAHNIAELSEVCKAVIEAGKPYKFIVLDTITALEEMSKPLAAKLYMATPMGKNYQGGGEGILALPSGGGYLWLRNAIEKIIDMVAKCADNIILVGHVKDKAIVDSEGKEQGSLKDFDMTGKISRILAAKSDGISWIHRDKDSNLCLNFETGGIATAGARPKHLANKDIIVAENNGDGTFTSHWERIFPSLKA